MPTIDFTTTVNASYKISPSILSEYATKTYVDGNYVSNESLTETLKGYTPEINNPDTGVVYGRAEVDGELVWVPMVVSGLTLYYGMNTYNTIPSDVSEFINSMLVKFSATGGTNAFTDVSATPTENSYFWFLCTNEITSVVFTSGSQSYTDSIDDMGEITINIAGVEKTFYCYRTSHKYAAIKVGDSYVTYTYNVNTVEL